MSQHLASRGAHRCEPGATCPGATHDHFGGAAAPLRADGIRASVSDVDVSPLRLVADTFLRARINRVEDFDW